MSFGGFSVDDLPNSDLPEIAYRLTCIKEDLECVNDDFTQQEIYDRISMSAISIGDVLADLNAINRVLLGVVDA